MEVIEDIKEGYITDYISGIQVKATPEETQATQIFSKSLVEDYGYPKDLIQTRPQLRLKRCPSDPNDKYPIDIAIFNNESKALNSLYIIVECKQKTRKDGLEQLKTYLSLSSAKLGVWFNGEERLFLQKIISEEGLEFVEIPNIPQYGQGIEDIGLYKRKDLKVTHNLKSIFRSIRNHLAGNFSGATRDEELAKEIINIIFCKLYDEKYTPLEDIVNFRSGVSEKKSVVKKRILELFENVKTKYPNIITGEDRIELDEDAIYYIVGELQSYCLMHTQRDVIADAFEVFIGYALKGAQGQFFTPRNVVKLMVKAIDPKPGELVIDPACGSGGFLIESLKYLWDKIDEQGKKLSWNEHTIEVEKNKLASGCINGIEKDKFLCKVAKAYMTILGDGESGIFCEDSLNVPSEWHMDTTQKIQLGKFDVLLTNPPFGKEIKVIGKEKLSQYDLSYKWKKVNDKFEKTTDLKDKMNPEVLFVERSLQLLKDGGRMGIILPETFFFAPKSKYVMDFIARNNNITWIIDIPHNTFRPHNNAKCIVIIFEKNRPQQDFINMAIAEEIGHNHQGKELYRWDYEKQAVNKDLLWDDVPLIINEMDSSFHHYCFRQDYSTVEKKSIFVPRYYWNNKMQEIEAIAKKSNVTLVPIKKLISEKILTFFDGHGSPAAENKGMGDYPYIRVKDIVNWDIYKDPTAKIPEKAYNELRNPAKDLEENDILYVRRGSYRIGSVAIVSNYDLNVVLTREILVIRLLQEQNKYNLTPYYLLYLLSTRIVQEQSKNKVLIETTLPNIADRWKELKLPISNDIEERIKISKQIEDIVHLKRESVYKILDLEKIMGCLNT